MYGASMFWKEFVKFLKISGIYFFARTIFSYERCNGCFFTTNHTNTHEKNGV